MSAAPRILAGLSEIAHGYDAALVDAWGVIHNGRTPFLPALEACRRFRAERGPVVVISNAPRPSADIPGQLLRLGAGDDFYDAIVTSGDATRAELAARAPGPAYRLGPPKDLRLYDDTGLAFAGIEEAAFISCTGPVEEDDDRPEDYAPLFEVAVARGIDMVCANPDLVVQKGDRLIICAGALARQFESQGGRVVHCGKPHAAIYALALARVAAARGAEVAPARVLAIGDGPDTDLAGAEAQGFGAVFVADGIHRADVLAGGELDARGVAALLRGKSRRADYAMTALRW
jgi:HAD superfamily hydrolase (TIGR01459 family)